MSGIVVHNHGEVVGAYLEELDDIFSRDININLLPHLLIITTVHTCISRVLLSFGNVHI